MTFKIISTTDIHGVIFPTDFTSINQQHNYGLSKISTRLNESRNQIHTLFIDNGDSFQGTPLCTFAHQHLNEMIHPVAKAFNDMHLDYYNLGNHDFNYGKEVLFKFIKDMKAPLLTSNVLYKNEPLGQSQIIEIENKKVAIIGVLTHYIDHWEQPSNIEGFEFKDAYLTLKDEVLRLKDSVDYVIGVYHGGLERDPYTNEPTERLTGENQGSEMTTIDGLDLLITGHQHRNINEIINDTLVTQCAYRGQKFVEVTIDFEKNSTVAQLVDTSQFEIDTELLAPLSDLYNKTQAWLDLPIGHFKNGNLRIENIFDARKNKHRLVSFLNQIQRYRTNADISSVSLFDGANGFNQEVTMRDLVSTYPYPNTLVTKKVSGKILKEILEFTSYYWTIDEKGQLAVSPEFSEPKPQHYNYDMIDGIEYTIDVSKPRDQRITKLVFNGNDVRSDDQFIMVMNNYRAQGGGNYWMIQECETLFEDSVEFVDVIMQYFLDFSPIEVKHVNNINIIV